MRAEKTVNPEDIEKMTYVQFMAFLSETNRPPGGKVAFKKLLDYCDVNGKNHILDVGCNTGFCSFEAATLKRCKVTGLDLSEEMIETAKRVQKQYDKQVRDRISFLVGDAKGLPFEDDTFDFVFSGGSTFFVDDRKKALYEYMRVVKPWSFIGDMNFFYERTPPGNLMKSLEQALEFSITPFMRNDWLTLYQSVNLEIFDCLEGEINQVSDEHIEKYVNELLAKKSENIREKAYQRLSDLMTTFNENHKYLKYGSFILRNRALPEEPYLFMP